MDCSVLYYFVKLLYEKKKKNGEIVSQKFVEPNRHPNISRNGVKHENFEFFPVVIKSMSTYKIHINKVFGSDEVSLDG